MMRRPSSTERSFAGTGGEYDMRQTEHPSTDLVPLTGKSRFDVACQIFGFLGLVLTRTETLRFSCSHWATIRRRTSRAPSGAGPGGGRSQAGVSEISCLGRAVDPVQAMARVKRSPKRMAN